MIRDPLPTKGNITYNSWLKMKARCDDSSLTCFPSYGGKGIKYCKKWSKYANFYNDMGPRPTGKTLDRINNNKGYSPSNCRWADRKTQTENRTNTRWITLNGETKSFRQWSDELGLTIKNLYYRANKGWPPEKILQPIVFSSRGNPLKDSDGSYKKRISSRVF